MKRNMVPLLGIAFVVATISTGVFYGLFAGRLRSTPTEPRGRPIMVAARDLERGSVIADDDLRVSQVRGSLSGAYSKPDQLIGATLVVPIKENEPFLQERVVARDAAAGSSGGDVPSGMRAVSIRVAESDGVSRWLHPGARIDLQAVSDRNGTAELRTILQNVEVVAAGSPGDPNGANRGPVRVISVLARSQDADLIALADSAARIRVAIRNPLDEATSPRRSVGLASVFRQDSEQAETQNLAVARPLAEHPVQLHVQVLAVSSAAESELEAKLNTAGGSDSIRVATFQAGANPGELVQALKQKHELEVLSSRDLTAGPGQPVSYRAQKARYHVGVRFARAVEGKGNVVIRVTPEIGVPSGQGMETRQYDADVSETASFLVEGMAHDQTDRRALEQLFPGSAWGNRRLVFLVTQARDGQGSVSALVPKAEGR